MNNSQIASADSSHLAPIVQLPNKLKSVISSEPISWTTTVGEGHWPYCALALSVQFPNWSASVTAQILLVWFQISIIVLTISNTKTFLKLLILSIDCKMEVKCICLFAQFLCMGLKIKYPFAYCCCCCFECTVCPIQKWSRIDVSKKPQRLVRQGLVMSQGCQPLKNGWHIFVTGAEPNGKGAEPNRNWSVTITLTLLRG